MVVISKSSLVLHEISYKNDIMLYVNLNDSLKCNFFCIHNFSLGSFVKL